MQAAPTPNDSTVMQTAIARIAVGHAPTPSDRAALEPCDDVDLHWAQVKAALAVKAADHKSMGDDVKPLSQLSCDECDMWRYLQLAKRIAAIEPSSGGAPVVGICAPTGAGKSTLVQLLRMLLERVLCIGQTVEVSLDDFLSSQKERQQRGIKTRWDVNSTNEDFAPKLAELKHSTEASVIELPMFEKARDDRRTGSRRIEGKVACVLFEGWRVGVDHPNFAPFNAHLDLLVYVEADLEAIFVQKQEAAARGVASTGGHDMYAQYGGFKGVVERFYRPIAQEHILPVAGWSDVVLRKAGVDAGGVPQHTLEGIDWHVGRWQAHKSASRLETLPCVVVGGGQAGLCASYFLQKAGVAHTVLEKHEVGATWQRERWDSFKLVTENRLCALPDFPCTAIGEPEHGFMVKGKIIEYLQAFAAVNNLPVRCGRGVRRITRGWRGWVMQLEPPSAQESDAGAEPPSPAWIRTEHVVMAIGGFHEPRTPEWAAQLPSHIVQLQSRDYKNPVALAPGAVVVVGSAQSGTQIATELAEHGRSVYLCLSTRSLRVPRQVMGRDITWWLWRTGLYDATVNDLTPEERKAKRSAPNPQQAGGRDIRLRDIARRHKLVYVGRASGVSADGTELLVDGASVPNVMAKIESFPDDRRQHMAKFLAEPSPPPRASPAWLLDHPHAQSLDELPPMETEPSLALPRCETHPLRAVPLTACAETVEAARPVLHRSGSSFTQRPSVAVPNPEAAEADTTPPSPLRAATTTPNPDPTPPGSARRADKSAAASSAASQEPVGTVIFACGFKQAYERLIELPVALSDEGGYPLQTRGVSDVAEGLYFLGLPWLHKWKSVTLLGCAEDAEHVTRQIIRRLHSDAANATDASSSALLAAAPPLASPTPPPPLPPLTPAAVKLRPSRLNTVDVGGKLHTPFEAEEWLRSHMAVLDALCFPVAHATLGHVLGAAVVLRPGRITSYDELRSFGRERRVVQRALLPELIVFMSALPSAPRHALAAQLGLPTLTDDGDAATTYDAGEGEGEALAVRAVEAAGHRQRLDQFLSDEARPAAGGGMGRGAGGAVELSMRGLRNTMTAFLRAALTEELMQLGMLRADTPSLSADTPLITVGLESLGAAQLRQRVLERLGCHLPFASMQQWSVAFLSERIAEMLTSGGGGTGGAVPSPALASSSAADGEPATPAAEAAADDDGPFDMSPLQRSYMVGREQGHGAWLYWETDVARFDKDRFTWAVRALIERHAALRTLVTPEYTQQVMSFEQVRRDVEFELHLHAPAAEGLKAALHAVRGRRQQWARAASYPLFSIEGVLLDGHDANGTCRLSFLFDLLIADAASLNVLTAELGALYTAPSPEDGLRLLGPIPSITHKHAAEAKRTWAASAEGRAAAAREEAFWALKLRSEEEGGLPAAPQLPLLSRPAAQDAGLARLKWRLEGPLWEALQANGKLRRLTPTQALLAAYASVLATWASSRHFTLTLANFGRERQHERVVGQLADVMLIEVDLREPLPFEAAASTIVASMLSTLEHSVLTSGVDVMRRLNARDGTLGRATSPYIFASVLGASPAPVVGETADDPARADHPARLFTWYGSAKPVTGSTALDTPQVILDHQCFNELDGSLLCHWDYDPSRFPPGVVEGMFEAYTSLLRQLASREHDHAWTQPARLAPRAHVSAQCAIQQAEHRPDLLASLRPVHATFFDAAHLAKHARSTAVSGEDGEITFGELSERSLRTAAAIERVATRASGEVSLAPVAVALPKSCAQVIAVLASLASGRAYVPVALNQPADRIRKILQAVQCAVTLVGGGAGGDGGLPGVEWPEGCSALPVELASPTSSPPLPQAAMPANLSELSYIIFTSGSTGTPKGVAISHLGACNTCLDINERFAIGAGDVVLSLAALSFDLSVYDLFGVLAAGGSVAMPHPKQGANPEHWLELLEERQVTVWNTAPPVMTALLEYVRVDDEAAVRFRNLPLRVVMLSGDFCPKWVPTELQGRLTGDAQHPRTQPVSVYTLGGATEASIWSCYYPVESVAPEWKSIPYGKPLANQGLYVLDRHLNIMPSLVPGEICIGGVGLAECYWADRAKTDAAFVYGAPRGERERLYKTGDMGRYMADGSVEILGRMDFQLKLHGYRIEIGEVEAALNTCDGVGNAVALPWPPLPEKPMQLIGFVQCDSGGVDAEAGGEASHPLLQALEARALVAAKAALPTYMVPAKLHVLFTVQLSANGKVDRKWLQSVHREYLATHREEASGGGGADEPRTPSEVRLAKLLRGLVGASAPITMFSDFTALGIDSAALLRLKPMVDAEFQCKVPFTTLLEHLTVSKLGAYLDAQTDAAAPGASLSAPSAVCFNTGTGGLPPFFCVAPVAGQVLCYKELASRLGHAQPFYALQSPGVNEGETPLESVEAIASALVANLKAVLDSLPQHQRQHFWLGGWSMGGVVAFEMALQLLHDHGMRVEQLVLMDSPAPIEGMPTFSRREMAFTFADDMLSCRSKLSNLPPPGPALDARSDAQLLGDVLDGLEAHAGLERGMLERTYAVYAANLTALSAYRPDKARVQAANLTAHLLKATQRNEHIRRYPGHSSLELGWVRTGLRASSVLLYVLASDHYFVTEASMQPTLGRLVGRLLALPTHAAAIAESESLTIESRAGFQLSRYSPPESARPPAPAATRASSRPTDSLSSRRHDLSLLRDESEPFAMETGSSNLLQADRAALEAYTQLLSKLGRAPHLLVASCSSAFDGKLVVEQLRRLAPNAVIHGTTSFSGCISRDGKQTFGLMGIHDPTGRYAVGISGHGANVHATARECGRQAARQALASIDASSSFVNELPTCALVNAAVGAEEEVIKGIEDIVRKDCLLVGGSCADQDFNGKWWVCAASPGAPTAAGGGGGARRPSSFELSDGVVITLMWPSVRVQLMVSSCFEPSAARGVATRVEGRTLWEVDGEGAADWYARHGGSAFRAQLERAKRQPHDAPITVLAETTLGPLGRWVGATPEAADAAAAQSASAASPPVRPGAAPAREDLSASDLTLVHPARIVPCGGASGATGQHGLECFANFTEGDAVVLMAAQQGVDTLSSHPSNVMSLMDASERVRGCLVIYCAGCAGAIGESRLDEVAGAFSSALHHPFFGLFT